MSRFVGLPYHRSSHVSFIDDSKNNTGLNSNKPDSSADLGMDISSHMCNMKPSQNRLWSDVCLDCKNPHKLDRFKAWESSGVTIVHVLSQPDDSWVGEVGYVQAAFARAKQVSAPESTGSVLCGYRQMAEVEACIVVLAVSRMMKENYHRGYPLIEYENCFPADSCSHC